MKKISIKAVFLLSVLLFCSCQSFYPKLILGEWTLSAVDSYFDENGKRNYCSFWYSENRIQCYHMNFLKSNQLVISITSNEKGSCFEHETETSTKSYRLNGSDIYINGELTHIVKLTRKKLVLEGFSDGEFVHLELFKH